MSLESAEKEVARSQALWDDSNFTALRKQMEEDFRLWGPYEFKMPKSEGKWNNVSTNSSKILMNKAIGLLASSWPQLFINVTEEDRKGRANISATERVGNGCIFQANRNLTRSPSGKTIQDSLSAFAPLRGGLATRVYLYEKDGKLIPDIRVFDPMRVQWLEGPDGLFWFCHRYYESIEYLKQRYGDKFKEISGDFDKTETETQRTLCLDVWGPNKSGLIVKGKYLEEDDNKLGYIPVKISSCGAVPVIQSEKHTNTMKYSWVSAYANDRDIYDLDSMLMSIESSKAIESGKIKVFGTWDSTLGEQPDGIKKLGYSGDESRNEVIMFDKAKGQEFGGMVQPPSNEIVERFASKVAGRMVLAGIDPIAQGNLSRSGISGTLAAELRLSALEFLSPFQNAIEETLVWAAEESASQFKNRDFGEASFEGIEFKGRDSRGSKYLAEIKPEDIDDGYHFECNLVIDRLRDEVQELGAAIQTVQNGLSSRRTAMTKHNIVEDPDLEMDIMDEELANQDPLLRFDKLAKKFKDLGTEEGDRMALYYQAMAEIQIQKTIMAAAMPEQEGQRPPPGNTPQAQTGEIASQIRS